MNLKLRFRSTQNGLTVTYYTHVPQTVNFVLKYLALKLFVIRIIFAAVHEKIPTLYTL